jgi:hypothetical protein
MDAANSCAHHAAVGGLVTLADPFGSSPATNKLMSEVQKPSTYWSERSSETTWAVFLGLNQRAIEAASAALRGTVASHRPRLDPLLYVRRETGLCSRFDPPELRFGDAQIGLYPLR